MPAIGSNIEKLRLEFGLLMDVLSDGNDSGKGLPLNAPFDAVMNGVANSGGPGLV